MKVPDSLEGSRFLSVDGETCMTTAWKLTDELNKNFPCPEFLNYKGDSGVDIS